MTPPVSESVLLALDLDWPFKYYLFAGLAVLVVLFAIVVFIVSLCERQYLVGDVEPAYEPYPYPATPYWRTTRDDAIKLGLRHAGDFATKKDTTMVKGLQSMFMTQDNCVLVSIVSGSVSVAKMKKTVLRSRLPDGRVLESSDNPGLTDHSGVVQRKVLLNAGIAELLDFHLARIQANGGMVLPFNPNAAIEEYERIDLERAGRWVERGLARWADQQQTSIRMTVSGACAQVAKMFKETDKLDAQDNRTAIKRAGSRPGEAF